MIIIIDYGMGNLGSILNMMKKIGSDAKISSDISELEKADKLIFPGVGAFDAGMKNLESRGLTKILNKKVLSERTPVLGICLGMQLLTKCSEEGLLSGFGWIDAGVVRFDLGGWGTNMKIPHMGWNTISVCRESPLFKGLFGESRFYFVHSYHVLCNDESEILAKTSYGYDFTSVVGRGNIFGVQFHPEKSHKFGMRLLKNFSEL